MKVNFLSVFLIVFLIWDGVLAQTKNSLNNIQLELQDTESIDSNLSRLSHEDDIKFEAFAPKGIRAIGESAEKIHFYLKALQLSGNTIYSNNKLKVYYENLLKKQVGLAQLYEIAEKITSHYHRNGYILSQAIVPEQRIRNGIARIEIIEGSIGDIQFQLESEKLKKLESYFNVKAVKESIPLSIGVLERNLLLLNDLPGITAEAILRPGKSLGLSDLLITLNYDFSNGSIAIDNYGTRYLGQGRFLANIDINSMFGYGESLSISEIQTKDHELQSHRIYSAIPLGNNGLKLNFSYKYNSAAPEYTLSELDIKSLGRHWNFDLFYPIIRSRRENLIIEGGVYARDLDLDLLQADFTRDNIRATHVKVSFDYADRFGGLNVASLQFTKGINELNATPRNSVLSTRPEAAPDFVRFNGELVRLQKLYGGLQGFNILGTLSWQFTDEPLYASEEFTIGGRVYGQGYDPGEINGDRGVATKLELQRRKQMDWGDYTAYGFYTLGKVWNLDNEDIGTERQNDSLSSVGVGIRICGELSTERKYEKKYERKCKDQSWFANLELAKPLTRIPAIETHRAFRWYFSLGYKF